MTWTVEGSWRKKAPDLLLDELSRKQKSKWTWQGAEFNALTYKCKAKEGQVFLDFKAGLAHVREQGRSL